MPWLINLSDVSKLRDAVFDAIDDMEPHYRDDIVDALNDVITNENVLMCFYDDSQEDDFNDLGDIPPIEHIEL